MSHLSYLQVPNGHGFLIGDGDDIRDLSSLALFHHPFPNYARDRYRIEMLVVDSQGIDMCDHGRVKNRQALAEVHIFHGRNLKDFQFADL